MILNEFKEKDAIREAAEQVVKDAKDLKDGKKKVQKVTEKKVEEKVDECKMEVVEPVIVPSRPAGLDLPQQFMVNI